MEFDRIDESYCTITLDRDELALIARAMKSHLADIVAGYADRSDYAVTDMAAAAFEAYSLVMSHADVFPEEKQQPAA